jgi:phosphatidylglycerophosphate synthase
MLMQSSPGPYTYQYHCVDRSKLTRWLSVKVAPYIDACISPEISPNQITVSAALFAIGMVSSIALTPPSWASAMLPLCAFLLLMYCILDHVDGYRARKMGHSSAWGEFLDHGVDSGVVSLVGMSILICSPVKEVDPLIATYFITSLTLATVMLWVQQYTTGSLNLPAIGPVEGIFTTALYMLACMFPYINQSLAVEVFPGVSRIEVALVVISSVILGLVTYRLISVAHTVRLIWPFLLLCILVLSTVHYRPAALFVSVSVLAFSTLYHASTIIFAHLTQTAISFQHKVLLLSFPAVLFETSLLNQSLIHWLWLLPICISVNTIRVWVVALRALRPASSLLNMTR